MELLKQSKIICILLTEVMNVPACSSTSFSSNPSANVSGRVYDAMFASASMSVSMSNPPNQSDFDRKPDLLEMIVDDEIKNLF